MAAFDPYRKWLGIPPEEQPPDHYRLLGIARFESDADVISNAADRQMVHVRSYQSGKHSALSQKLLNELSAARICLLDPKKRAAYDAQLRKRLAAEQPAPPPAAPPPAAPPAAPPPAPAGPAGTVPVATAVPRVGTPGSMATTSRAATYATRRKKASWQGPVITVGLLLVSAIIVLVAVNLPGSTSENGAKPAVPAGGGTPHNGQDKPPGQRGNGQQPGERPAALPGHPKDGENGGGENGGENGTGPVEVPALPALPHRLGEMRAFEGLGARGTDAVLTPDGEFILGASKEPTVRLWDVRTGTYRPLEGISAPVLAVAVSRDGKRALTASARGDPPSAGEVIIWDIVTLQQTHRIDLSKAGAARDAAFSPDGNAILLACQDGTVRVLDAVNNRELKQITGHDAPVRAAVFTDGGAKILSGSEDGTVRLWDAKTRAELGRMTGHQGAVLSVDVAPDGSFAVSGGADRSVRVWDLAEQTLLNTLGGHAGEVRSVAVSPDSEFVLSGGADGSIRLWKMPQGVQVLSYKGHLGGVRSVAFSSDGRMAVSTGDDAAVRLWGMPQAGDFPPEVLGDAPPTPDAAASTPPKLPVPDAQAQKDAEAQVRNVFASDFASADKPAQHAALARKLLSEGSASQSDAATVYVLLRLAWGEATKGGATDTALRAVDEIDRRFEVDALAAKAKTLGSLAQSVVSPTRRRLLVRRALDAVDEALAADAFAAARQILATAANVAEKARDGALRQQIEARLEDVAAREQQYQAVEQARKTLEDTPGDAAAHEAVGRYICFQKGRWSEGLPHLAKAADEPLRQLAETELAAPDEPAEQLALADAWWNVAEQQGPPARENIQARAAKWYRLAEPELAAFDKTRADQRLAEVDRAGQGGRAASALPSFSGFECRRPDVKVELLLALGGSDAGEAAVERALEWIVAQQQPHGFWTFTLDGPRGKNRSPNPGTLDAAPNAATALALLPLLAAGNDGRLGDYRREVGAGLTFLRGRLMASTGVVSHLTPRCGMLYEPEAGQMPSHALGTIALCEAAAMNENHQARTMAQASANFLVATQNQDGGWAFQPYLQDPAERPAPSDVYATAWNVAALKAAEWAGLDVPGKVLQLADRFLNDMNQGEGKGYGRGARNRHPDPTATAAAVYSQMLLGWPPDQQQLVDYVARIAQLGPSGGSQLYQDFYHVQIMREAGGDQWPAYNRAVQDWLIESQVLDGPAAGSWYFDAPGWSVENGGRLFCTAVAVLMLETYYRNPLLYPAGE